jgi:hypothetical protein
MKANDNSTVGVLGLGLALAAFGTLLWYESQLEKTEKAAIVQSQNDSSEFISGVQEQQFQESLERLAKSNDFDND